MLGKRHRMYKLARESLLRAFNARRLPCSHSAQGSRNAARAPVYIHQRFPGVAVVGARR